MKTLSTYLPKDRYAGFFQANPLPDRAFGAVLFTDIYGVNPLTEKLTTRLRPRRGIEKLTGR